MINIYPRNVGWVNGLLIRLYTKKTYHLTIDAKLQNRKTIYPSILVQRLAKKVTY
jgi:hypothetical protein